MASETTTGSNIDIVREYTERVFNQHSPDLAAKYLAPGVTWHGQTLGTIKGVDNVSRMLRGFIGALPDLHAAEQNIVAAGDTVAVRYVIEATQEGNLLGIAPTGRRVRWTPSHLPPCRRDDRGGVGRRRRDGHPASTRRLHPALAYLTPRLRPEAQPGTADTKPTSATNCTCPHGGLTAKGGHGHDRR